MKVKVVFVVIVAIIIYKVECKEDFLNLGILHTIPRYAQWHAKEEMLVKFLRQYQEMSVQTKTVCLKGSWHFQELIKDADKRRGMQWLRIRNCVRRHRNSEFLQEIAKHLNLTEFTKDNASNRKQVEFKMEEKWVGSHDMFFTSMTWIQLMEVYMLRPADISHGLEFETAAGGDLRGGQKTDIGAFALLQKRFYMAVEWLEEGYACGSTKDSLGMLVLSLAIQEHNKMGSEINKGLREGSYTESVNLYNAPVLASVKASARVTLRQVSFERYKGSRSHTLETEQFMDLCQGNMYQSPKTRARLKCYYDRNSNAYFVINPVKTEKLSVAPPLYQFYDVMGNATIEHLKGELEHYVKTGVALGHSENDIRARCGTSAGTGLDPDSTPTRIYAMSEMVSGLKLLLCPKHDQFVEYAYGRWYRSHSDHSSNRPETMPDMEMHGDRMATMLYYLEVPTLGGYTPFLSAGVYPHPVKGSAIVWFNSYRNGTLRNDVEHGACPVIHGNKIIMTHFFRYNTNWNKHKCTRSQLE